MEKENIVFIPISSGQGGLNIRDVKRWKIGENGSIEVEVKELKGITTHLIHSPFALVALRVLQEHTAS